jgi:hypothetical protein
MVALSSARNAKVLSFPNNAARLISAIKLILDDRRRWAVWLKTQYWYGAARLGLSDPGGPAQARSPPQAHRLRHARGEPQRDIPVQRVAVVAAHPGGQAAEAFRAGLQALDVPAAERTQHQAKLVLPVPHPAA